MSWETIKLGDIADFSNGVNFDKSAYSKGVKLIGVSNFGNRFSPDYNSLEEIKIVPLVPREILHIPSPTVPVPTAAAALSPAPAATLTFSEIPNSPAISLVTHPTVS